MINVNDIVHVVTFSETSIYDNSIHCRLFCNYVKNCSITNTDCIH